MKGKCYTKVTKYVNVDLKRQSKGKAPSPTRFIRSTGQLTVHEGVQVFPLTKRDAQTTAEGRLLVPHHVSAPAAIRRWSPAAVTVVVTSASTATLPVPITPRAPVLKANPTRA